jgi:hypothetical protein
MVVFETTMPSKPPGKRDRGRPLIAPTKKRGAKIQAYITDDESDRVERVRGSLTRSDWGARAVRLQLARDERKLTRPDGDRD